MRGTKWAPHPGPVQYATRDHHPAYSFSQAFHRWLLRLQSSRHSPRMLLNLCVISLWFQGNNINYWCFLGHFYTRMVPVTNGNHQSGWHGLHSECWLLHSTSPLPPLRPGVRGGISYILLGLSKIISPWVPGSPYWMCIKWDRGCLWEFTAVCGEKIPPQNCRTSVCGTWCVARWDAFVWVCTRRCMWILPHLAKQGRTGSWRWRTCFLIRFICLRV